MHHCFWRTALKTKICNSGEHNVSWIGIESRLKIIILGWRKKYHHPVIIADYTKQAFNAADKSIELPLQRKNTGATWSGNHAVAGGRTAKDQTNGTNNTSVWNLRDLKG